MLTLKAYTYRGLADGSTLLSEHVEWDSWRASLADARESGATVVLLHVGFERLADEHVNRWFSDGRKGVFLTEAATSIRPSGYLAFLLEVGVLGQSAVHQVCGPEGELGSLVPADLAASMISLEKPPSPSKVVEPDNHEAAPVEPQGVVGASPDGFMDRLCEQLRQDEAEVLRCRWGYSGEPMTLDQLGKLRDVSRERIRQIEAKAIRRLLRPGSELQLMLTRLREIEQNSAEPVPYADLFKLETGLDARDMSIFLFRQLLKASPEEQMDLIEVDGITYLAPITKRQWDQWIAQAGDKLQELADREAPMVDVGRELGEVLPPSMGKFSKVFHQAVVSSDMRVAIGPDGDERLVALGGGVKAFIKTVLFASKEPLHRTEVIRQVRELSSEKHTDATIGNAISEVAVLLGRGEYGLRQHIPLTDDEIEDLVAAAEEIVLLEPERQWKTIELCREVTLRELFASDALGKYVMGACLRLYSKQLQDVKRGVWTASGTGCASDRIHIRDRIVEMLEDAGRPLSTEDLKARLMAERGLDETFQIQPRDRLFRSGKAMWGLLDRDLPIAFADTGAYLDALKAELLRAQKGIHVEEVNVVLARAGLAVHWIRDPEVLLALARRRGDLRVTQSRYLVLPDWSNERRVLPAQAIIDAVKNYPRNSSEEVACMASERTGRSVTADTVRSVLNNNDYSFDRSAGMWIESAQPEIV